MSNVITIKGKTVEEAVLEGLKKLNLSKQEVNVTVVQEAKKGVLGIGAKEAVVELVKKKEEAEKAAIVSEGEESSSTSFTPTEKPGAIWLTNGEIKWVPSEEFPPKLTPCEGITLYKNGNVIEESTFLTKHDQVEISVEDEQRETNWEISIDGSKMAVTLTVEPGFEIKREMSDIPPNRHLQLTVKETKTFYNALTEEELLNELKNRDVREGIQEEEIKRACETEDTEQFLIAAGIPPEDGKDGFIEFKVEVGQDLISLVHETDDKIDFREIKHIPSVEEDELIAVIHLPVEGKPGRNVSGEPVEPEPVHPVLFQQGKGIRFEEEIRTLYAAEKGRPEVEAIGKTTRVSIVPKFVHPKNVDLDFGNLHFNGDVEVLGSVEEEMLVEAVGSLLIHGNVEKASIKAGSTIIFKESVITSTVSAGKSNHAVIDLIPTLKALLQELKELQSAVSALIEAPKFQQSNFAEMRFSMLVKLLVEKKFKNLAPMIKQYIQKVKDGKSMLDAEWFKLGEKIAKGILLADSAYLNNMDDLQAMIQSVENLYNFSTEPVENRSSILLPYALNSTISCSGDVTVGGTGCYNSKIHSEGTVNIRGMLRGGDVYAKEGVDVKESGSRAGVPTVIAVGENGKIKIGLAYEGTTIKIGERAHTFYEETRGIEASLDSTGQLKLFN